MRRGLALGWLLATGCLSAPAPTDRDADADADADPSAPSTDAATQACAPPDSASEPIANLTDDFSRFVLGTTWAVGTGSTTGCEFATVEGLLRISGTDSGLCHMQSTATYNLGCGSVHVALDSATVPDATLRVRDAEQNAYELTLNFAALQCWVKRGEVTSFVDDVAFDGDQHRWWRLRSTAVGLVAEVSPNARTWIQVCAFAESAPASLADVSVSLLSDSVELRSVFFDDLNL